MLCSWSPLLPLFHVCHVLILWADSELWLWQFYAPYLLLWAHELGVVSQWLGPHAPCYRGILAATNIKWILSSRHIGLIDWDRIRSSFTCTYQQHNLTSLTRLGQKIQDNNYPSFEVIGSWSEQWSGPGAGGTQQQFISPLCFFQPWLSTWAASETQTRF